MTLDEIFEQWDKDSHIDETNLVNTARLAPKLHAKYYRMLSNERLRLRKMEGNFNEFKKLKIEYYTGTSDQSVLVEKNWKPFRQRLLKADIPTYMDADAEMIEKTNLLFIQKEKVELLDSIIKTIGRWGYDIKNALDALKYFNGVT